jgi:hypothetical protein
MESPSFSKAHETNGLAGIGLVEGIRAGIKGSEGGRSHFERRPADLIIWFPLFIFSTVMVQTPSSTTVEKDRSTRYLDVYG